MNYLDLFSGIGGFALAFQNAGFDFNNHYFSEVDKYATEIYERHFPDAVRLGDVRQVGDELEKIDIITGGFPCQSFSIAGGRRGFADTRGTLFFEIERLEGLLSHDRGNTIRVILERLAGLDYHVQLLLLNTKDFGIPQNRERLFFICNFRGQPRPEISGVRERKTETSFSSNAIDANYYKGIDNHGQRTCIGTLRTYKDGEGFRKMQSGICPTILASGQPIVAITDKRFRKMQSGICPTILTSGQPIVAITDKSVKRIADNIKTDIANTLTSTCYKGSASNGMTNVIQGEIIRRLTPIECERLQSFPDNWTAGISDTQRYKTLGNAVTVKVVEEIAKTIKEVL